MGSMTLCFSEEGNEAKTLSGQPTSSNDVTVLPGRNTTGEST